MLVLRNMRQLSWVATASYHSNQPVQSQYVPSYSTPTIQSNLYLAFNAKLELNQKKGVAMSKVRKLKTSLCMALLYVSAAA